MTQKSAEAQTIREIIRRATACPDWLRVWSQIKPVLVRAVVFSSLLLVFCALVALFVSPDAKRRAAERAAAEAAFRQGVTNGQKH